MSRLIVKGLPAYVDEKRLREHFGSKGVVTDAKVIRKKDGKSRCFGFLGFQEESSARDAVDFFQRTYMDTSRIHVEIAKPKGSSDIKRPWSQHSKGSSRHEEKHPEMYDASSPSQRVGGGVLEGFNTVKHRYSMLSLLTGKSL